jgi:hypothetical protein
VVVCIDYRQAEVILDRLRTQITGPTRCLSACVGEIEDKLDRLLPLGVGRRAGP